MPVIYIDVLLAVNLFIDFLLLSAVSRILRLPKKRIRIVLGALTGSICSCLIFLPDMHFLLSFAIKIFSACLIIRIAFAWRSAILYIKQLAAFFITSSVFAGIAFAVYFFAAPKGLYVVDGIVYYDVSPLTLTSLTVISYFALNIYDRITHRKIAAGHEYTITVKTEKGTSRLRALYDTGHHAVDVFSGSPVAVVSLEAIEPYLPDNIISAAQSLNHQNKAPAHNFMKPDAAAGIKLRLIPFRTVGGTGLLPAFCPKQVTLNTPVGEPADITGVYVAVCRVLGRGEYDAIIGPDILKLLERSKELCGKK